MDIGRLIQNEGSGILQYFPKSEFQKTNRTVRNYFSNSEKF